MIEPNATAKMGSAPLISPVTPDAMCCSASGKSVNGMAIHRTDTATRRGKSSRCTFWRAAGTSQSADAPKTTRSHVTSPGANASSPIAISRNDDPQINPTDRNRTQSSGVNAPRCVPAVVDITLRRPAPGAASDGSTSSLTSDG